MDGRVARRRGRRRVIVAVAGVLCLVLLAGVVGVSAFAADQFLHSGQWSKGIPDDPGKHGLDYEDVSFRTADGLTIRGWWIPAQRPVGTVLLLHGYAHNRLELLPQAPYLHAAGYDLLLFDWRSCGKSDGEIFTFGDFERRDLTAALDFASARGHGKIAAIGYSMGAATAILGGAFDPRLAAVVADSAFATLEDNFGRGFEQLSPLPLPLPAFPFAPLALWIAHLETGVTAIRPIDEVASFAPRPILFISGSQDTLVPPDQTDRLAAAAGEPRETLRIKGAGHPSSKRGGPYDTAPELYQKTVLAFLGRALGASAGIGHDSVSRVAGSS